MNNRKRYLRGDPDRPFPADRAVLDALLARYCPPTHEPPWFYRLRGTGTPAEAARSRDYTTVENVEVMRQLGLHMPKRADFFKGIGLVRERPHIDRIVAYARELHRRGMLLSVYVGDTMFTDYFFKEVPAARVEWIHPDDEGHPHETGAAVREGREAVFSMFTPRVYGVARVRFTP